MVETLRINNHDANERLTYQFRSNNNVFASNSGLFYKNTQYDMFIRDSCNENITKCFNGFYTLWLLLQGKQNQDQTITNGCITQFARLW